MRFLYILFITITTHAFGQSKADYTSVHYTDANGLPQNSIKCIAKDDAGYLWFANEAGLVRFDGSNFMVFDKKSLRTSSERVYAIRKNLVDGNIYAQTEYDELIPIEKGKILRPLKFHQVFLGLDPNLQIQESPVLYPEKQKFNIALNAYSFYSITKDSVYFHQGKIKFNLSFKRKEKFNFFVSENELFHLDSDGKFRHVKKDVIETVKIVGDLAKLTEQNLKNAKLIWNTGIDQAFILSDNAIYQIEYNGHTLATKLIIEGFDYNKRQIQSIYYDKNSQKVFLGSLTQGLFVLQKKMFYAEKPQEDISSSVKYALYPYNENSVLFANGEIMQSNGDITRLPLIKKHSNNFALAIDRQHNIWTIRDSSIYKISPDGNRLLQEFQLEEAGSCIYIDQDQMLWIGSAKGVYRQDLVNSKQSFPVKVLNLSRVTIIERRDNQLWIGAYKGLFQFNLQQNKLYTFKNMEDVSVRHILLRGANESWVCTYGDGFYLIRGAKLIKMPLDKARYLANAHSILEDKNGFFWISTNKGLFKVKVNDLLNYKYGQEQEVYYHYFNEKYGFNVNEFNGGGQPSSAVLKNGNFVFPSLIGSVMFNPEAVKTDLPENDISFDKIYIDLREIEVSDLITIDQKFSNFNIWVSSPYFGASDNQNLSYKLVAEENWRSLDGNPVISFNKLSPGLHELQIRKNIGFDGKMKYKFLKIYVSPYYYQTWWFKSLLVLFGFGLLLMFYKKRTQIITRRNAQLESQIQSRTNELKLRTVFQKKMLAAITHDIKTPLRYMMITGKHLHHLENTPVALKESLNAIYRSASNMYFFTENLLNYSQLFLTNDSVKLERANLGELASAKVEIFRDIASSQDLEIRNDVPEWIFVETNSVILSLIIHNLLDNAIKFSSSGIVLITAANLHDRMELTIKDTGEGIPIETAEWFNNPTSYVEEDSVRGLGLKMIKELSARINVDIKAIRDPQLGTSFVIKFHNSNS